MTVEEIMLWDYSAMVLTEWFMVCLGRTPTGEELTAMLGAIDYGYECYEDDDYDNYLLGIAHSVAEETKDF